MRCNASTIMTMSLEPIGRRVRGIERTPTNCTIITDEHSRNSTFGEESTLVGTVLSPDASDEERGIRSATGLGGPTRGESPWGPDGGVFGVVPSVLGGEIPRASGVLRCRDAGGVVAATPSSARCIATPSSSCIVLMNSRNRTSFPPSPVVGSHIGVVAKRSRLFSMSRARFATSPMRIIFAISVSSSPLKWVTSRLPR